MRTDQNIENLEYIKNAILQDITGASVKGEWLLGRIMDLRHSLDVRKRKKIISLLRLDGHIVIADKSKGYKIARNSIEADEYCERARRECIATYLEIKIMKARAHGDAPLFMQDFIPAQLEEQAERELEAANA